MEVTKKMRAHWRSNLIVTAFLLLLWFISTFVMLPFAPWLNQFTFLGFPLGFYLASQGSMLMYLLIIVLYVLIMNALDKHYGVDEKE